MLCLILITVITGLVRAEDTPPQPPELPQAIWQALLAEESIVLRADIDQLLGLPEVTIFLDDPSATEVDSFIFRRYVPVLQTLSPIADAGLDVWKIDGNNTFFVRTTLSREAIISEYRGWGWIPVDDNSGMGYLRQPIDDGDEAAIRKIAEERRQIWEREAQRTADLRAAAESGDPEAVGYLEFVASPEEDEPFDTATVVQEIRSDFEKEKCKMVPGDSGWLALYTSWSQPSPFEMTQPTDEELGEFRDFPLASFLEEHPDDLLVISIVFPDRDTVLGSAPNSELLEDTDPHRARLEQELHELEKEARALSGRDQAEILDRLGDMLLRINEIDGGLDIVLVAEIPGNPDDSFTADAIQMALGFLRMSVVSNSPELARELLDTTISASNGQLQARVNISHASLVDTIRRALVKQRRSREIWRRMEEIRTELADLESDNP